MSFVGMAQLSADYRTRVPNNSFQGLNGGSRWRQIDRKEAAGKKITLSDDGMAKLALDRSRPTPGSDLASKTVTGLALVEGSISLARHVEHAVPAFDTEHPAIANLSYVTGGIGLFLGSFVKVKGGIENLQRACKIGDEEGKRRASGAIVSGTLSSTGSAIFIANTATASAMVGLGLAGDALFGLSSLMSLGISGLNTYRCFSFRSQFADVLEDRDLTETERLVKALEFLKEKVSPTREEREAILKDPNGLYRNLSSESRKYLLREKLIDLAAVKIDSLKRRTSQKAVELIVDQVDPLLDQLRNGPDAGKIQAAKQLIRDVQKENTKRILLYTVAAIISCIAFAGLIAGTFFSLGALPFILYAISAGVGLAMILYPVLTQPAHKDKDLADRSIEMLPIPIIDDPTPV